MTLSGSHTELDNFQNLLVPLIIGYNKNQTKYVTDFKMLTQSYPASNTTGLDNIG